MAISQTVLWGPAAMAFVIAMATSAPAQRIEVTPLPAPGEERPTTDGSGSRLLPNALAPDDSGGRVVLRPPRRSTTFLPESEAETEAPTSRVVIVPDGSTEEGAVLRPAAEGQESAGGDSRAAAADGTLPQPGADDAADGTAGSGLLRIPGGTSEAEVRPLPPADGGDAEGDGTTTRLPRARLARGLDGIPSVELDGLEEGEFDRFLRAPPGTGQGTTRPHRPISLGPMTETDGAEFRVLDMIAGTTETVSLPVGGTATSGRLRIALLSCEQPEPGSAVGPVALLEIRDVETEAPEPDFSGWMFAESPALSALDHPRYDVWLISCTTRSAEAETGSE